MQQDSANPKKSIEWGTPVSILIHVAIAAAFLVNIPAKQPTPEQEQAVNVELVPPPEEKKPEEKKPEEAKQEKKKPDEKKPEEKPPVKPPEPPKVETKAEEPPPPPPPPPKEEAKKETKSEPPSDRSILEFGEKDAGPKVSDKGNASVDESKPETTQVSAPKAEPDPVVPAGPPLPASLAPKDINLPKVGTIDILTEDNAPPLLATAKAKTNFEPEETAKAATSDTKDPSSTPPQDATATPESHLKEAKTLFSRKETSDPRAQAAMGKLSRAERFSDLCWSELQAQLKHSAHGDDSTLAPRYPAPAGTVLDVKRGAFQNAYGWYNVKFRCEVDKDAKKILSFAIEVGDAVPRSEWKSRNFPDY